MTEFYIWAKTDKEAIKKAKEFALEEDSKKDNKCVVNLVSTAPFASLEFENIYLKS